MDEEKLRRILSSYMEWQRNSEASRFWKASSMFCEGLNAINKAKNPADKAKLFLTVCHDVAKLLPAYDWSLLPVLAVIHPETVCNEVLFYINNPATDTSTVSYQVKLLERMEKQAATCKLAMPSHKASAQMLCLLRFFRRMEIHMPFFPQALEEMSIALGYTFNPFAETDSLGMSAFYMLFNELRKKLANRFSEELGQINVSDGMKQIRFSSLNGKANAVSAHLFAMMLESSPNCQGKGTEAKEVKPSRVSAKQVLDELNEIICTLRPQVDFYHHEQTFFWGCFTAGNELTHSRYGLGSVADFSGNKVILTFADGKNRSFAFPDSMLDGTLYKDTMDYHKRMFFAKETLRRGEKWQTWFPGQRQTSKK